MNFSGYSPTASCVSLSRHGIKIARWDRKTLVSSCSRQRTRKLTSTLSEFKKALR
ncbi:hypothetical protein BIW11_11564, partial [Tropilaelaps mercedesae]